MVQATDGEPSEFFLESLKEGARRVERLVEERPLELEADVIDE